MGIAAPELSLPVFRCPEVDFHPSLARTSGEFEPLRHLPNESDLPVRSLVPFMDPGITLVPPDSECNVLSSPLVTEELLFRLPPSFPVEKLSFFLLFPFCPCSSGPPLWPPDFPFFRWLFSPDHENVPPSPCFFFPLVIFPADRPRP